MTEQTPPTPDAEASVREGRHPLPDDDEPGARHLAYVDQIEGIVELTTSRAGAWSAARAGMPLARGSRVRTRFSRARIAFESGSVLWVNRFTTLTVATTEAAAVPVVSMVGGEVYVETVPPDAGFRVKTPHGAVVDLGTRFAVQVKLRGTTVTVVSGSVEASTDAGSTVVAANQEVLLAHRVGPVRVVTDTRSRLGWVDALRERYRFDPQRRTTVGGVWRLTSAGLVVQASENAFLLFGNDRWRDYRLSACVHVRSATGARHGVGLVGYWIDERHLFRFRNLASMWELTRGYGHMEGYRKLARLPGEFPVGSIVRLALEVKTIPAGALLRAKFWPASEKEPERWSLEARSDALDIAAGRAGLWAFNCTVTFSEIEIERVR
jgi:hypothetical protein